MRLRQHCAHATRRYAGGLSGYAVREAQRAGVGDASVSGSDWALATASAPLIQGIVWPVSFSTAAMDLISAGETRVMATPLRPARPVRPMRWT